MLCWFLQYNKVNWLYVYIYIPTLLSLSPTCPPHPTTLGHPECRAELPVVSRSSPLAILHMIVCVQISQLIPSPSHLPMSTCLFCMSMSLFHPANRFIYTIFLESTYVH